MKIDFVRSGGFSGLRLALKVDTRGLPEVEANHMIQLVRDAGFFDLEPVSEAGSPQPDRFHYRLEIESRTWGHHAVILAEPGVPERMRPLLDHLTGLAMHPAGTEKPAGSGRPDSK